MALAIPSRAAGPDVGKCRIKPRTYQRYRKPVWFFDPARWLALGLLLGVFPLACSGGQATPVDTTEPDRGAPDAPIPDTAPNAMVDAPSPDTGDPLACNGSPLLCKKRFDEVVFPTTHNAFASTADGFFPPNQTRSLEQQLTDGVRGLMLDVYLDGGEIKLCHVTCLLGSKLLLDGLKLIAAYLKANSRAVLTIIFESYVEAPRLREAFAQAGLLPQLHAQPIGQPWPTLQQMIDTDRRLVVLTDRGGGTYPWYHDVWQHAWDTPFHAENPEELGCELGRGTAGSPLFILNHFLTAPVAMQSSAKKVNHNPFFAKRAKGCRDQHQQLPNFVTVDFYEIGDLFAVTRELNGLPP